MDERRVETGQIDANSFMVKHGNLVNELLICKNIDDETTPEEKSETLQMMGESINELIMDIARYEPALDGDPELKRLIRNMLASARELQAQIEKGEIDAKSADKLHDCYRMVKYELLGDIGAA